MCCLCVLCVRRSKTRRQSKRPKAMKNTFKDPKQRYRTLWDWQEEMLNSDGHTGKRCCTLIRTPRTVKEHFSDVLRRPLLWKSMLLETAWKPRTFPTCLWTGCVFRWKSTRRRKTWKLECCWGLAFFRWKSISKKAVPRRTPRFEVFTPKRHQEITRAFWEVLRCGWSVMMSDDDAMIYTSDFCPLEEP